MAQKKRKICFVITSFIHYSRNFLILKELEKQADVELHIVVAGTALLPKYASQLANIGELLKSSGHKNIYEVHFNLEGSKPVIKAKTAGLGVVEFASLFNQIKPDVVVVRGDRFEVLAAASAASLMNITIAHIEGGDVTGTIDESIRHAITKLSHVHFVTTKAAKQRVIRMGEHSKFVFDFGSPDIEVAEKIGKSDSILKKINSTGSGADINPSKDFIMVAYHPVTSELSSLRKNTEILLNAVHELDMQALWFWPNFDAGAEEEISHTLRGFKDEIQNHKIRFMRYVPPTLYLALLKRTRCLVGNSSAGVKECSYLGVPVVNVGSRQGKRIRAENVVEVSHQKKKIQEAIRKQINVGRYSQSLLYRKANTSERIARKLATVELYVQKEFKD